MIGTVEEVAGQFAAALQVESAGEVADVLLPEIRDQVVGEDVAGTAGVVVPHARWHDALAFARDGLGLDFFDWLSAVDQLDAEPSGLDVVAHLVQTPGGDRPPAGPDGLVRVLVRTRVPEGTALASVTDLWPGAAWHERETFEMFGLEFAGFEDGTGLGLRPLLLPEGFEGTPLRKSFVLAARASKPWPGAKEPGESDAHGTGSPSRRKLLPPGVPDAATWGPRSPGPPDGSAAAGGSADPGADSPVGAANLSAAAGGSADPGADSPVGAANLSAAAGGSAAPGADSSEGAGDE